MPKPAPKVKPMTTKDIPDDDVLRACRDFHAAPDTATTPDVALAAKYPQKLILAKMYKMAERGLIEYGVSIRTAWVVDGKA